VTWLLLVELIAASASLARLIAEDSILDRPRMWVMAKSKVVAQLIGCRWCLGTWTTGLVVGITAQTISIRQPVLLWAGLRVPSVLLLVLSDRVE
jgi:hypothetical protein